MNHPRYDATYTTSGRTSSHTTIGNDSHCMAFQIARPVGIPAPRRLSISPSAESSTTPASAVAPDHLLANAAPSASPAAIRQGRKKGEGTEGRGAGASTATAGPMAAVVAPGVAVAVDPGSAV